MSEAKNDWVVQAPKQIAQVPVGFYLADFKGVEDFNLPLDGSAKWRFSWEVKSGPEAGKLASALTDRDISANTLPGRLISGLLDRQLVEGENVKAAIEACIGKTFMVNVATGPKGGKAGVKTVGLPPQM